MSAAWRTSDLKVLAIAAVGTVVLTALSVVIAPTPSFPRQDGSSYAVHAEGARAAFLLLKEIGYRIDRSFEPMAAARVDPATTVLVLASPAQGPSDQDERALVRFLERGGTVLATGSQGAPFLAGVPSPTSRSSHARRQPAAIASPLSSGVSEIEMASTGALLPSSPYIAVYGSDEAPAVLTARVGEGRAIYWAGSTPLLNGGISRPGHVELLINALGPPDGRTILWDEFYHGHSRSVWSYLAATPLPVAGIQLAALFAAALFTYARRRQPIRARVTVPRTSPLEFIDTMGGLYERARVAGAAVATVRAHLRRRLAQATGLTPAVTDERLVTAAAERLALDATTLSALLATSGRASTDAHLSDGEAVVIVGDLQHIAAIVDARRGRR